MPKKYARFALALYFLSGPTSAGAPDSALSFADCRIGTPPMTTAAQCTTLSVPFTHGLQPDGQTSAQDVVKTITLAIAKIPARGNRATNDPLTLLAGGPGQSAIDSWPQLQGAFYPVLANRDIYLIDQRGTGDSARMDCPISATGNTLNLDLARVKEEAAACYREQSLPVEWFTTSVAVRDLDFVRQALGIAQWNLYGVSYGTRVALHYLRRYPAHTRSVILDAVVAPQKPIGPEVPLHAQNALQALFDRCEKDEGCAAVFPQLAERTDALFAALKNNPRTVAYENVSLGTVDSMEFNDQHLAMTVRLLSYTAYGTAILPSMLYDAAVNDNLAPFARQAALQLSQLDGTMASGMHAAVICTEDAPFIDAMSNRELMKNSYLGDSIIDAMVASCSQWPRGVIDPDFHNPIKSGVPVLALSGQADPITPPDYAELAIQSLSNARHIINPHQGHTQAPLGCIPTVMYRFIETADPQAIDITCLDRLSPPAPFVDANGPLP